jgi:hypothetical protein
MQRVIALLGWLSFAVWLLSAPGCGGLEAGWRLDGIPEETAQAALDEGCQVGGYCDTLNPDGVHTMQLAAPPTGRDWLGNFRTTDGHRVHWILVSPKVPADRVRVVLLHELGHHFRGRGHLPPGHVMAQILDDSPEHLTEADISGSWGLP